MYLCEICECMEIKEEKKNKTKQKKKEEKENNHVVPRRQNAIFSTVFELFSQHRSLMPNNLTKVL